MDPEKIEKEIQNSPINIKKAEKVENSIQNSPTNSQKTISSDDEIDYSTKPDFYDPILDNKDELYVQKRVKKGNNYSDAVLSCPACFTTLCFESQRHEKYVTQYRAVFVVNCKVKAKIKGGDDVSLKRKRGGGIVNGENELKDVLCCVCSTEVGVFDEDEVYHFFNVLPSEC